MEQRVPEGSLTMLVKQVTASRWSTAVLAVLSSAAAFALVSVLFLGSLVPRLLGEPTAETDRRLVQAEPEFAGMEGKEREKNDSAASSEDDASTPVQARIPPLRHFVSDDDLSYVTPSPQVHYLAAGPTPETPPPPHPDAVKVPARSTSPPPSPSTLRPRNLDFQLLAAAAPSDDVCRGCSCSTSLSGGNAQATHSSADGSISELDSVPQLEPQTERSEKQERRGAALVPRLPLGSRAVADVAGVSRAEEYTTSSHPAQVQLGSGEEADCEAEGGPAASGELSSDIMWRDSASTGGDAGVPEVPQPEEGEEEAEGEEGQEEPAWPLPRGSSLASAPSAAGPSDTVIISCGFGDAAAPKANPMGASSEAEAEAETTSPKRQEGQTPEVQQGTEGAQDNRSPAELSAAAAPGAPSTTPAKAVGKAVPQTPARSYLNSQKKAGATPSGAITPGTDRRPALREAFQRTPSATCGTAGSGGGSRQRRNMMPAITAAAVTPRSPGPAPGAAAAERRAARSAAAAAAAADRSVSSPAGCESDVTFPTDAPFTPAAAGKLPVSPGGAGVTPRYAAPTAASLARFATAKEAQGRGGGASGGAQLPRQHLSMRLLASPPPGAAAPAGTALPQRHSLAIPLQGAR